MIFLSLDTSGRRIVCEVQPDNSIIIHSQSDNDNAIEGECEVVAEQKALPEMGEDKHVEK